MLRAQNSNINIRVSKELKEQFVGICKEQGVSYSKLLRKFMREYISDRQGNDTERVSE
jgi:antitoxin component of RelBE/YafQ-DinJ toxin-antitoxin module